MIPDTTIKQCHISQEMLETLQKIRDGLFKILEKNLIGIYLHGSIALKDFDFKRSDIDMLVVTQDAPSNTQKKEIIDLILAHEKDYPKKGIEISFIRIENCKQFVYPTPFDLHFSYFYLEEAKKDSSTFSKNMHGLDSDLACHFTITREKGVALFGPEPKLIFSPVPQKYYMQSILSDLADGKEDIYKYPYYYICNLCRTLAYLQDGLLLSKQLGIMWAVMNDLPYAPRVQQVIFPNPKLTNEHLTLIYQKYMELIFETMKKNHIELI